MHVPLLDDVLWRITSRGLARWDEARWRTLTDGSRELARDRQGDVTLHCSNGLVAKTFSLKRRLSSAVLRPYARRFADNARDLHLCGIGAPEIADVFALDFPLAGARRHGVTYRWIAGTDLRSALAAAAHDPERQAALVTAFGRLVGELHGPGNGVDFRSLHFGNVLVAHGDQLQLLDVVDCTFGYLGEPLEGEGRAASLRQLLRYPEDEAVLRAHPDAFMAGYLEHGEWIASDVEDCERRGLGWLVAAARGHLRA